MFWIFLAIVIASLIIASAIKNAQIKNEIFLKTQSPVYRQRLKVLNEFLDYQFKFTQKVQDITENEIYLLEHPDISKKEKAELLLINKKLYKENEKSRNIMSEKYEGSDLNPFEIQYQEWPKELLHRKFEYEDFEAQVGKLVDEQLRLKNNNN